MTMVLFSISVFGAIAYFVFQQFWRAPFDSRGLYVKAPTDDQDDDQTSYHNDDSQFSLRSISKYGGADTVPTHAAPAYGGSSDYQTV